MVKLENEYFVRFILLVIKGGSQILRKIVSSGLEKQKTSLEKFLNNEKQAICSSKDFTKLHRDKLYYSSEPPDISNWDISLLSRVVLLDFFGLDSSQSAAVKKIRELRNQYQAHTTEASIEIRHFHTVWNELVLVITFLSHEIDKNDRLELMDLINNLASEQLDLNASIEELKMLDRTDEFFESIQRSIERMEQSIQQEVRSCHQDVLVLKQTVIPDLTAIKQELLQIRAQMIHNGENIKDVYTVFGKVRVSAIEQTTVDTAEQILLSASRGSTSDKASTDINHNVKECIDKFKEDVEKKDVTIVEVNKGSVTFTFECLSLTAVIDLIDYFDGSGMQSLLVNLERTLSDLLGQTVYIIAYIPDKPMLDIVAKLKNIKTGAVQFSMQCTGVEGLVNAWDVFEEDAGYDSLNNLSSALSKAVGQSVKLTTDIDTKSFKEAITKARESIEVKADNPWHSHEMGSDAYNSLEINEEMNVQKPHLAGSDLKEAKATLFADIIEIKEEYAALKAGVVDLKEENATLLADIIDLCERSDCKNAEVILLIGKTGAGKSALVNTVHKAITGKYYAIARQGSGRAQTVTMDLSRYDNCGVSLETITDEERRHTIEKILPKLPHIVDCAGLGDEDSPELREILELLVGGFIPPKTHIEALQSKQKEFGVGCLKRLYPNANPAWAVTKVVFLQSCTDSIPKNLIESLMKVLKTIDQARLKRKYSAEVFLLITKYDLVSDTGLQLVYSKDGYSESLNKEDEGLALDMEHFVTIEKKTAFELNMIGALEARRIRWISFTDRISDNPWIDNNALKFLKLMLEPGPPVSEPVQPVMSLMKSIELHLFRLGNGIQRISENRHEHTWSLFVVVSVFVTVIAILYMLLSVSI
ncbi:uncharacterized protein LOC123561140 isoform X2 [Mercenaria mercenaria]|uniref:uncharacterized protein LOC123561140 isoform X2 n=1 Tax=Mercenaria mercenaria TaxID=6596 RepID=UPI00234E99B0|nr:uncharacterized protein LOC123561140 isoform X2 [Mercenaria mercenaria]